MLESILIVCSIALIIAIPSIIEYIVVCRQIEKERKQYGLAKKKKKSFR